MAYTIEIITSGIFTKDMYCRPLDRSYDSYMSDYLPETSAYTGMPINNFKWLPIICFLGEYWFGKTIEEFESNHLIYMEWAKGNIPDSHIIKHRSLYEKF